MLPSAMFPPTAWSERLSFLLAFARSPLRTGAVTPSTRALAQLITRDITPTMMPLIEFGPGTGVFTRALLAAGLAQGDLTLIEIDPTMARRLQKELPGVRVLLSDVADETLAKALPQAGAIVSGLPILTFGRARQTATMRNAFATLRPGGVFLQFTYGPRCPVPNDVLEELGLEARFVGSTLRNLPPASVYRITRHGEGP